MRSPVAPGRRLASSEHCAAPTRLRWAPDLAFAAGWTAAVLVFWFVLFRPSTFAGVMRFEGVDLVAYFYPKVLYGMGELLAGRLPLWNPYEYGGLPFLATAQPATLYPPWLVVYGLAGPSPAAYEAFMILHYALTGLIGFAALRWLGSSPVGAAVGAVVLTFNPWVMDRNYHPTHIASLTWTIGVFAAALATIDAPGPRPALCFAALLSLELLAGYPEFVLDTGMLLALLVLARLAEVARRRGAGAALGALVWLAAGGVLFLLLTAMQWVPLLEMLGESYRAGAATTPLAGLSMRAVVLGGGAGGWARATAEVFHLPPAAWLCALAGLVVVRRPSAPRAGQTITWVLLATIAAGLVLLLPGPLHELFPFRLFRSTVCWGFLFYVPTAVVAARGLDACLSEQPPWRSRSAALALAALGALSLPFMGRRALGWLLLGAGALVLARRARAPIVRAGAESLLVATAILAAWTWIPSTIPGGTDLYWHRYSRGEYPLPDPPTEVVARGRRVEASCHADRGRLVAPLLSFTGAPILAHLPMINGYPESLAPARMKQVLDSCGIPPHTLQINRAALGACAPWLDRLDVTCAWLPEGEDGALAGAGFTKVATEQGQATYRRSAPGRLRLVPGVVAAKSPEEAFELVRGGTLDAKQFVVLEDGGAAHSLSADGASGAAAPAPDETPTSVVRSDEAGTIAIDVTLPRPMYAVLSEAYYPGWHGFVDGSPVPVYRADFALMAAPVPAGSHRLEFRYSPASVRLGTLLSIVGAAGFVITAAVTRRRGRS